MNIPDEWCCEHRANRHGLEAGCIECPCMVIALPNAEDCPFCDEGAGRLLTGGKVYVCTADANHHWRADHGDTDRG